MPVLLNHYERTRYQFPFLNPNAEINVHQRNLPHWQQGEVFYFVTWRLADSLPAERLSQWQEEKIRWLYHHPEPWDMKTEKEYHERFSQKIDHWLDAGHGSCLLRQPAIAKIVDDALKHFNRQRYHLDTYVIMPNHVHVLFQLRAGETLEKVVHSWKSFTAKEINSVLKTGRMHLEYSGKIWQEEYWDRMIRNERHLLAIRNYIVENPKRNKTHPL